MLLYTPPTGKTAPPSLLPGAPGDSMLLDPSVVNAATFVTAVVAQDGSDVWLFNSSSTSNSSQIRSLATGAVWSFKTYPPGLPNGSSRARITQVLLFHSSLCNQEQAFSNFCILHRLTDAE